MCSSFPIDELLATKAMKMILISLNKTGEIPPSQIGRQPSQEVLAESTAAPLYHI
jgi:hypothetical protein